MIIAYFVHNLNDPAVHRRIRMLHLGGATVRVFGFCRGTVPSQIEGCVPVMLGETHDARLIQRLIQTIRVSMQRVRLGRLLEGVDAIMARQLEMLAIAQSIRSSLAVRPPLSYECLDIHRVMLKTGGVGRLMRYVERRLLRSCSLLIVSSPGFVREYFKKKYRWLPQIRLSENKVLVEEAAKSLDGGTPLPISKPWRIGWFGNLRCRRSLLILDALTRSSNGLVEVVIRGRPATTAIPDFDQIVESNPALFFLGPYDRNTDLAVIYGDVHFAWVIDFFEAGGNSEWLLPNRLYECSLYGTVALALRGVETGKWLAEHNIGILVGEPMVENLAACFAGLDSVRYAQLRRATAEIPIGDLTDGSSECHAFVRALQGVGTGR